MAGTMSQADLVADLKASLHDAAAIFNAAADADFNRMLDAAALDFGRVRRRTLVASVTLVADQSEYTAPSDMLMPKLSLWGINERTASRPWSASWPGRLPRMSMAGDPGSALLILTPAPTQDQITLLQSTFKFYYFAGHKVDVSAANTTIRAGDRALFLLRAQAEAAKEMTMRNMHKPVSMRDGISGGSLTGTPSALFKQLMDIFETQST